jgi:hypothetical protein
VATSPALADCAACPRRRHNTSLSTTTATVVGHARADHHLECFRDWPLTLVTRSIMRHVHSAAPLRPEPDEYAGTHGIARGSTIPAPPCAAPQSAQRPWLQRLWLAYRADVRLLCPDCGSDGTFVLAVSYSPRGYQLRCSRCLWRSPWFDWQDGQLALLGLDRLSYGTIGGQGSDVDEGHARWL